MIITVAFSILIFNHFLFYSSHVTKKPLSFNEFFALLPFTVTMHLKIHLIAIVVIVVLLTIVFVSTKTIMPIKAEDEFYIEIINATWGMNCKDVRHRNNTDEKYSFASPNDELPSIRPNNVLFKTSELCNNKPICAVNVSESTFGFNPDPGCSKMMEVEFRCFSYDRPWYIRAGEFETLTIDCTKRPFFK